MAAVPLYDALAGSYDMLISWKRRLRRERPFFKRIFKEFRVSRILDTACGTGMHAVAFHDWGFDVIGADISGPMIAKARENSGDRKIEFVQAGFEDLREIGGLFDAVTCLGNSLPHVLTDQALDESLGCMLDVLLPGGIIVIHNNNYDRVLARQERFMPLAQGKHDGKESLFVRFFDFRGGTPAVPPLTTDELLAFNVVALSREHGAWRMTHDSSSHRALTHTMLIERMESAGFIIRGVYGGFPDEPYQDLESDNLIIVAEKPHTSASQPRPEPVKAIDRIPICDDGDPLVNVLSAVPGATIRDRPVFLRRRVTEMLVKAQSLLPDGCRFRFRTGYRTLEYQLEAYNGFHDKLAAEHPNWPESQLRRELNKFLAPPDAGHPPGHTTGGAVDLSYVGPTGEEPDMMSSIDPEGSQRDLFPTYFKRITPRAAKNRQILVDAMLGAGFSNYPGEWWHYSYGDSAWAVRTGAPYAFYGEAKDELPADVLAELNMKRLPNW